MQVPYLQECVYTIAMHHTQDFTDIYSPKPVKSFELSKNEEKPKTLQ